MMRLRCRYHHAYGSSGQRLTSDGSEGGRDTSVLHSFVRFVLGLALPQERPWGPTDHVIVVFDGGASAHEPPEGKPRPLNYRKQLLPEYKVRMYGCGVPARIDPDEHCAAGRTMRQTALRSR